MSQHFIHQFLFGVYPYICFAVWLLGSLIRFDREQYTWKSDSSQLLRRRQLRLGSNLFHIGVLVVIAGHFAGFFAPHWLVSPFVNAAQHQWLAMVGGGIAGVVALVGLSILLYRRLADPRIRINSAHADILVLLILGLQLVLGLATVPLSFAHSDGVMFETLSSYVTGAAFFRPGVADLLSNAPFIYKAHILVGFTIFLISPFTRLVHIWSGVATLAYPFRPHQIVRKR